MPITPASVANVAPQQPVPTRADLKPPVEIVAIGPSANTNAAPAAQPFAQPSAPAADPRVMIGPAQATAQPTIASPTSAAPAPAAQQPASAMPVADASPAGAAANGGVLDPSAPTAPAPSANSASPSATASAPPPTDQDLASVAASHGEPLVGNDGRPVSPASSVRAAPGNGGDYVAQDGDTLSHMAARFLGANTATNRNAIIRLNPQLKANPDRIIVGQTYHIPPIAQPIAQPVAQPAAPAMADAQPSQETTNAPSQTPTVSTAAGSAPSAALASSGTETLYTVQPNDSLWKIASQQLGTPSAIDAIKELNKDVLKGDNHDVLYVGMKIKLPARVAQANLGQAPSAPSNPPVTAQ
jgi:DNA polymerase-3 subunit gamma/tau